MQNDPGQQLPEAAGEQRFPVLCSLDALVKSKGGAGEDDCGGAEG